MGLKKAIIIYVVLLHLLLAFVLLKSDFLYRVQKTIGVAPQSPSSYYSSMLSIHRAREQTLPARPVLFIGDSMFERLNVSAVSGNAVNFGISGDTTEGVLHRLGNYSSLSRAESVLLLVGINDMGYRSNADIIRSYNQILEMLSGVPRVLVISILPLAGTSSPTIEANQKIRRLNTLLERLCSSHPQTRYIDLFPALIDADGSLRDSFQVGDGLHLNARGYKVLVSRLRTILDAAAPAPQEYMKDM